MDFEKLNEVVKFGLAPEQELKGFFTGSKWEDGWLADNANDLVLADFLAEHDDPREHIVRKDLSYRGKDAVAWRTNKNADAKKLIVEAGSGEDASYFTGNLLSTHNLPDKTRLDVYHNPRYALIRELVWYPPKNNFEIAPYHGVFTKEEAHEILTKLGLPTEGVE